MVWLNEVTDPLKKKSPHANCTTFAAVVPSDLVVAGGGWASFTSGSVFSWTEVPFVVLSKMSVTVSVSDAPVHWGGAWLRWRPDASISCFGLRPLTE